MNAKLIEELARKLAGSLPPGMRAVREDIEQNFRAVLQAGLTRMDLVTREEFEVQQRVLERSREKLAALESRIAALEAGKTATH
ncbi:MAG: accessory factor UbiK family protein [Gammaproteobacteria bacterium]|nr:accessory factor UbiK family protein [Gammaproteobacteria bacterium]